LQYDSARDAGQTFPLRTLLTSALLRLTDTGGDPVVELQTNFGGGKTHSMLALYHLFSGSTAGDLIGLEPVLQAAGGVAPPRANIAVLVGSAPGAADPRVKPDGTVVHTLWGEMAHQLLGAAGYALVANADRKGVSPGSDTLREIFRRAAPCLVLIDEWVMFVRMLYNRADLPAGSFDSNMSFAQSLTEGAKASPRTLVVASIPASDIEVGGEAGREALARLKNIFARVESGWRPASADEGFEIVRRRLFQDIPAAQYPARDAVVRAFSDLYRTQQKEFPPRSGEGDYRRRLEAAYPIHPELFDRLYNDWSTLERFQRTRGVLRLMATAIRELWNSSDRSLLVMPYSIPVGVPAVQSELALYLDDHWSPVIDADIDGANALPRTLDASNPNLGRYGACQRVARTVFMGSAPTLRAANRGLEDSSIKLGCVQPGESPAIFGDALRKLTDGATYLYVNDRRYWFSTQPSVTRVALDRAAQLDQDLVWEELRARLRKDRERGEFAAVHSAPESSADVPDEQEARLVVLGPEYPHSARDTRSKARQQAEQILAQRGSAPRLARNMLVFLAPDSTRLAELEAGIRQYLAWKSILEERQTLNLDAFQSNQATTKTAEGDRTVESRMLETYIWLLTPEQPSPEIQREAPGTLMAWQETRLQGQERPAVKASRKLQGEELLVTTFAPTRLRLELDSRALWRGSEHINLKQLWDYIASYLYMPRFKNRAVLVTCVQAGIAQLGFDTFAYAEGWDEARARYLGLVQGRTGVQVVLDGQSVLVKPDAASRQIAADEVPARPLQSPAVDPSRGREDAYGPTRSDLGASTTIIRDGAASEPVAAPVLRRFHGTVDLNALRVGRDAGIIAQEIIQHLTALGGAEVTVTLEIDARLPGGAPEQVVRTVAENCRTLKFSSHAFEDR
jgi:predicted AAA+ superfamily ATPase